jgi:RNA polymerase sigma factor (sigma-70 family)
VADRTTDIGMAGGTAFPSTRWSQLLGSKDGPTRDYRQGLERILLEYWKPVYVYVRRAWGKSNEDAKDLAQSFFADVIEKDLLSKYAPQRGRFRTFLKAALKNFLADEYRTAGRKKRGGGRVRIPTDADVLPLEELAAAPENATPEACFDRAWANEILAAALVDLKARLAAEKRGAAYETLEIYDLAPPPGESLGYRDVAQRLKRTEAEVKADLAYARQRLREALAERVRLYCENDSDVFKELNDILSL